MAIKINGVTVIADTQAITTTSTISATGNILGGANLSVTGTITAAGVNTGSSPISTTGNVTGGNILTGGTVSATGAITGAALTGTSLTVTTGNITGGNLLLSGAIIDSAQLDIQTSASNSNIALAPNGTGVVTVSTQVSAVGNVTGGNIRTAGLISATGNITGGNVSATNLTGSLTTAAQANITSVGTLTSLNSGAISSSGNVTGANLLTAGLISSTGNITGGNVSATNLTGSLTTAAQANITSVGTLTSVSVTGNVQGGNIRTAGLVSATGNIIGGNLVINGNAQITGNLSVSGTETIFNVANLTVNDLDIIVANNVTGGANINGAGIQAGNPATATWFYNNATTSWQSNIGITPTANGTLSLGGASNFWGNAFLTTASVTGNVQGGNIRTAGLVSATGTVTGSQFNGSGAGLTSIPNGALSNSSVTLGSTALTLGATVTTVAGLSSVTSTTFVGALTGAATTAGTVTTAAQPNITSVGTMSTATITTLSTSAITKTGTNAVGNIGQTDNRFNTIFATATSALYADLAEKYVADAEYAPGTVVVFGGSSEVTVDAEDSDRRVAGVVSTNPAYIMNDGLAAEFVAAVALTGRVPCLVTGTVRKGDLMVAAGLGRARAEADPRVGTVIGKALEDHDGESGTIEVVVGRF